MIDKTLKEFEQFKGREDLQYIYVKAFIQKALEEQEKVIEQLMDTIKLNYDNNKAEQERLRLGEGEVAKALHKYKEHFDLGQSCRECRHEAKFILALQNKEPNNG